MRGGGVSVFVRDCYKTTQVVEGSLVLPHLESVLVRMSTCGATYRILTVYRPPGSIFDQFFYTLNGIISSYKPDYICGDFNIDLLTIENNQNSATFLDGIRTLSFLPVIGKPTRIGGASATLIDNIFVRDFVDFISGIIICDLSDHLPIFIICRNANVTHKYDNRNIEYRDSCPINMSLFYDSLYNFDFSDVVYGDDLNLATEHLCKTILTTYEDSCPIIKRVVSYKHFTKPWITVDILNNIKKRNSYNCLFLQGKISRRFHNGFRNMVTEQIRKSKRDYFNGRFEAFVHDARKTWKTINSVLRPNQSTLSTSIEKLIVDGETYKGDVDVANAFNSYFATVGSRLASGSNLNENQYLQFMNGNFPQSMYLYPVSVSEVASVIASLKNKSNRNANLSCMLLKFISPIISPVLEVLINKCFVQGIFPDCLKKAYVVPIPKSGDRTLVTNYRPISILPAISKVFEKLIHCRICGYLDKLNILFPQQYGFRKGRSTGDALNKYLQYVYSSLDRNTPVLSFFLDFKKAFDCVNHDILMSKLYYYGLRGPIFNLLTSYLSNRRQCTVLNGSVSSEMFITAGVPQGSILGPLLFIMFINDFPNCTTFFDFVLYADDSTLSCQLPPDELDESIALSNNINFELSKVHDWLKMNKITLNLDKTSYMIFSYRKKIKVLPFTLDSSVIGEVSCVKLLGVHLDNRLTFEEHVAHICTKISKTVGVLGKLTDVLPIDVLEKIYRALILPYLVYCVDVWYTGCMAHMSRVVILQKRVVRIVSKSDFLEHTGPLFKIRKILPISSLHDSFVISKTQKHIHNVKYQETLSLLSIQGSWHKYSTRDSSHLVLPLVSLDKTKCSFVYKCISLWNQLPNCAKSMRSGRLFKSFLSDYFFNRL